MGSMTRVWCESMSLPILPITVATQGCGTLNTDMQEDEVGNISAPFI